MDVFLARKVSRVGCVCFWDRAALQKMRRWVPQCRQDHERMVAPAAFPKPCQASSEGWAAGFKGLDVLG